MDNLGPVGDNPRMSGDVTQGSLDRTKVALREAAIKVDVAAPTAEHAGASVVATEMTSRAPVRTGKLRSSIHAEGGEAIAAVSYAIPVNSGTINMAAIPFATDAVHAATGEVEAAMIAVFRTALGGR